MPSSPRARGRPPYCSHRLILTSFLLGGVLAALGSVGYFMQQTAGCQQQQQQNGAASDQPTVTKDDVEPAHHSPPSLLHDAPLYMNDKTIRLSPYIDHLWFQYYATDGASKKPTTKILLTDFGWNHPDPLVGLTFSRSMRTRELTQAVVDHPLFDPLFRWNQMETDHKFDPSLQYFVFLDVETCFESNYPRNPYYGGHGHINNFDSTGGRQYTPPYNFTTSTSAQCLSLMDCKVIARVLASPLFQTVPTAQLFIWECRGNGPDSWFRRQVQKNNHQISLVSLSTHWDHHDPDVDMGQPPPAVNPVRLSLQERTLILDTCDNDELDSRRPYFLTCVASAARSNVRQELFTLHDPSQGVILMDALPFKANPPIVDGKNITSYRDLLKKSLFSAVPRGDNRFSYRLTEVLSAGSIPVIHSDDWVLPFRKELIDWPKECAIVIPEKDVLKTMDILRGISIQERCQRRRRCYEVYTQYMANAEGTIAGVLESATRVIAANG